MKPSQTEDLYARLELSPSASVEEIIREASLSQKVNKFYNNEGGKQY